MVGDLPEEKYRGKKVLITGHTGFKGSWLTLWLLNQGADVYGYALAPPTKPALFHLLGLKHDIHHEIADIRDTKTLRKAVARIKPDIIFHLAAQSVVRESYLTPAETVEVNTLGTINVMEAVRAAGIPAAMVMITTDKCYENKEWIHGYRENDPMGGYDPYSASKGAAELLISSWRNSFFNTAHIKDHGVRIASARAGNVIGGGDWTKDALIPDCIRDLELERKIQIRNPAATRPWQFVLEPLSGYLELGARLLDVSDPELDSYCEAFNFGPQVSSNKKVSDLVEKMIEYWGSGRWEYTSPDHHFHESNLLHLSIDKAYHKLQWRPRWNFDETIAHTIAWYRIALMEPSRIREFTLEQIRVFESAQKNDYPVLENQI
jgi:CDP-glucose 4,6-dehydratase